MIERTEAPAIPENMPEGASAPTIRVEHERLVFALPNGDAYAIQLQGILESGDVQAALLWGVFFQMAEMVGLQRQIINAAQQQRAEASAQLVNLDPAKLMREMMAAAANGGGPASPGGDGSRTCSGGTVTPKGA